MRLAIGLLALAWSVAIFPPSAMSEGMDPVLVGGDELSDACPSLGRVIGRSGRTASALRTVVGALAGGRQVRIDIVDLDR